jgi:hypothetical protein
MSAAEDRSLHLSIPDWLPQHLEHAARTMHAWAVRSRSAESIAVVQRLVGDPRMKTVWAELQKRRRADAAFVHEADALIRAVRAQQHGRRLRSLLNNQQDRALFLRHVRERHRLKTAKKQAKANLRAATAELKRTWETYPEFKRITGFADFEEVIADRTAACDVAPEIKDHDPVETSTGYQEGVEASTAYQFAAMEVVFRQAVSLGQTFGSTQFWKQTRQSYIERASKARSDAGFLERAGRHHINNENNAHDLRQRGKELQRYLRKTAEKYEAYANLLADGHLDSSACIEFAQRMAGTLNDLFGKRMISTVATIASVALDRAITPVAVREWCL